MVSDFSIKMATERRWWAFARAFQLLPLEGRKKVTHSKPLRSTYLRIARVHPYHGGALDELCAPLRIHVFVAYAPDLLALPLAASQQARFEAVMKFFEENRRWPLPPELKPLVAEVEEKWLGKPRPTPQELDPPGPAAEAAEAAEFATTVALAVAVRDPEMWKLLMELASRRRRGGSRDT